MMVLGVEGVDRDFQDTKEVIVCHRGKIVQPFQLIEAQEACRFDDVSSKKFGINNHNGFRIRVLIPPPFEASSYHTWGLRSRIP